VPIVITSALRSPEDQAKLMISGYHRGSDQKKFAV